MRRTITEVPVEGERVTVRIARSATVEVHRGSQHQRVWPTCASYRQMIHYCRSGFCVRSTAPVAYLQRCGITSTRRIRVARCDARTMRSVVAKVPVIRQRIVVRIARSAAIERSRNSLHRRIGPARVRYRRRVWRRARGDGRGRTLRIRATLTIADGQGDVVRACGTERMTRVRGSRVLRAIAEIPIVGKRVMIGVAGSRPVKRDIYANLTHVRPGWVCYGRIVAGDCESVRQGSRFGPGRHRDG